jgi:hypothetical protein
VGRQEVAIGFHFLLLRSKTETPPTECRKGMNNLQKTRGKLWASMGCKIKGVTFLLGAQVEGFHADN